MSASILSRERGVTLRCNGDGCSSTFHTALIRVKPNRAAAKSAGWIRGGRLPGDPDEPDAPRKFSLRADFCPTCAPAELEHLAQLKKARDARRKKRAAEARHRLAVQREQERQAAQGASASP